MLAGGLFSMISFADGGIPAAAFFSAIPAAILGGGLLFLGGRLSLSKKTGDTSADSKVEIRIDPAGVWSCLRGVMLSIDKSLGEAQEVLSYERSRIKPSSGSLLSPEEAELFSGILESAYSRREEEPDDPSADAPCPRQGRDTDPKGTCSDFTVILQRFYTGLSVTLQSILIFVQRSAA